MRMLLLLLEAALAGAMDLGRSNASTGGCGGVVDCLRCNSAEDVCVKCPDLIVYPSRQCVRSCPGGHSVQWSTFVDYMGRMCVPSGYIGGLSGEHLAILVGACSGLLFCVVIILFGALFLTNRRKQLALSKNLQDLEDSPAKRDFLKQLETLRPHGATFLDMLNDTRRQLRELHSAGDNAAASAYRPVVRDLAKILLLLNRPSDRLHVVPDDWTRLFGWAEKLLRRYKRMSNVSQHHHQVAQLIDFLQSPGGNACSSVPVMSTFKPDQVLFGSQLSLQEVSRANGAWSCYAENSLAWQANSREYLSSSYFPEDDFFTLGYRPQDEITTEL